MAIKLKNLVDNAMRADSKEFIQLVEDAHITLSEERGHVGSLRIKGRLVYLPTEGNAIIVSDLHGDVESLLHILRSSEFLNRVYEDENVFIIFLGDYGDRGFYSPEVYYVVLRLKIRFPEKVVLLRGNHEGPRDILAQPHDLPVHLNRKFGKEWSKTYLKMQEIFPHLYNAVIIDERYVMLHGGIPSKASTIDDIAYAHKKHPKETHLEEILWSDPRDGIRGTHHSPRGAGRLFGEDITDRFLEMLNCNLLIRGHEPSGKGFKMNHCGKILTLFSRRGPPYYNECGAYLFLNFAEKLGDLKKIVQHIHKF